MNISPLPLFCISAAALLGSLCCRADYVELRDGKRMDGLILAENENSLEIQIGSNAAGTIRKVLVIDYSEIVSWSADAEGRTTLKGDVNKLEGMDYLSAMLKRGEAAVSDNEFLKAEAVFKQLVDLAGEGLEGKPPAEIAEALEMRAHVYKLLVVTLEGKADLLESKIDERTKEMEIEREGIEEAWEEYEDDVQDEERSLKDSRIVTTLGTKHARTELEARETELRARIEQVKVAHLKQNETLGDWKELLIKTKAEISLVEERSEKADDEAKQATRALRRR